jgi:hypothetical protein
MLTTIYTIEQTPAGGVNTLQCELQMYYTPWLPKPKIFVVDQHNGANADTKKHHCAPGNPRRNWKYLVYDI